MSIQGKVQDFAKLDGNEQSLETNEIKQLEDYLKPKGLGIRLKNLKKNIEEDKNMISLFSSPDFMQKVENIRAKAKTEGTKSLNKVEIAFLAIGEYVSGDQGSTFEVTEDRELLELGLEKKVAELNADIENGDFSATQKEALKNVLADLSGEVKSLEELEKRMNTSTGTLNGTNDFIEGIYNLDNQAKELAQELFVDGPKATIEMFVDVGIDATQVAKRVWNTAIKNGMATIDDAKNWASETYTEVSSPVEDGYYKLVELGIATVDNITKSLIETNQDIKKRGIAMIDKGVAKWDDFTDVLIEAGHDVTERGKELIEEGKVEVGKFLSYLSTQANLAKQQVADFVKKTIGAGLATADQVISRCGDMIKSGVANAKEFVGTVISTLVYASDVAVTAILAGLAAAGMAVMTVADYVWESLAKPTIEFGVGLAVKVKNKFNKIGAEILSRVKEQGQDIKKRGIAMIDKGVAKWDDFTDVLIEAGHDVTERGKELIEEGKVEVGKFLSYLSTQANLAKQQVADFVKETIDAGLATADQVISRCGDMIKSGVANAKEFVGTVISTLVYASGVAVTAILAGLAATGMAVMTVADYVWESLAKPTIEFGVGLAVKTKALVNDIIERMKKEISDTGEFIKQSRDFLYKKAALGINKSLDFIHEKIGNAKDVFITLYQLGKVKFDYLASWVNQQFDSITDAANTIVERGKVLGGNIYDKVSGRMITQYETAKKEVLSFIYNLVERGKIILNKTGNFFGSVASFCKELIDMGVMSAEKVFNFLKIQFKNGLEAGKKMLEWGIAKRDDTTEWLYKAGITIKDIAKTVIEYGKVAVGQLADKLFALSLGVKEKIGEIIDGIMEGMANMGDSVREWAFEKYSTFMTKVDAAKRALHEMKEYINGGIAELGDWLLRTGMSIVEAGKTLVKFCGDKKDQAILRIINQYDDVKQGIVKAKLATVNAFDELGEDIGNIRNDFRRDTILVGRETLGRNDSSP